VSDPVRKVMDESDNLSMDWGTQRVRAWRDWSKHIGVDPNSEDVKDLRAAFYRGFDASWKFLTKAVPQR
jgi:hypothetical protein